jgi:DNA-binding Lrp family transcriptional regulator
MVKIKLTVDNVYFKEPTRSILNLLMEYHRHGNGLEAKHFRYALSDEYDSSKNTSHDLQVEYNIKKLQEFFGIKLEKLYDNGEVIRGCITSRSNLNYYLKRLVELGVIKKIKKIGKIAKYGFSNEYYREIIRNDNIKILNIYDQKSISIFNENDSEDLKNILYGISDNLFDSLSKSKKNEIKKHIHEIQEHIRRIYKIKMERINRIYLKKIKKILSDEKIKKSNNIKLDKNMKFLKLINTFNEYNKMRRVNKKTLPYHNIWDIWEENMGFSPDKIKGLIQRGEKEFKDILLDYKKKQISFSVYYDEVRWDRNIGLDTVLSDIFDAFEFEKDKRYNDLYDCLTGEDKK